MTFIWLSAQTPLQAESFGCNSSYYTLACFEAYDTALLAAHRAQVDAIAAQIRNSHRSMTPIDHVTMVGHSAYFLVTDPVEEMAQARAQAAAAYLGTALTKLGVTGVAIEAGNVGTREPRSTNETQTGRDLNRRVEVHLRSTARIASRFSSLQAHCAETLGKHRVERLRTQTCAGADVAAQTCAQRVAIAEDEALAGAFCFPLDIRCVVCRR